MDALRQSAGAQKAAAKRKPKAETPKRKAS